MNCKPGDLVRFAGSPSDLVPNCFGWVGRAVRYEPCPVSNRPAWHVDPPLFSGRKFSSKWGYVMQGDWVGDEDLRPIRDPGDDARDETLDWLPVPHKEVA